SAAAGAGPASTSCFVTGSMRTFRPSSERAPRSTRSPGSPKTTSSLDFGEGVQAGADRLAHARPCGETRADAILDMRLPFVVLAAAFNTSRLPVADASCTLHE